MKKTIKIVLKIVSFLFIALVLFLTVGTSLDAYRVKKIRTKAASIYIGDTLQSVISTIGEPCVTFPKGSKHLFGSERQHKELVYGSIFDWKNAFLKEPPFFFPFKFRLFGPYSDDLVIVIDDKDRVLEIRSVKINKVSNNSAQKDRQGRLVEQLC
ncbi:MAG: hypothetical protein AB1724_13070 [Thermodesulfobacteriota bacterium]